MQTHLPSNPEKDQQAAIEQLASAVVNLSAQRQLHDYRQRAERSSLVNQALQAYRAYTRLSTTLQPNP